MRKAGVPPSEVGRLTLTQAMCLLDDSDPDDPFRHAVECDSPQALWEALNGGL